MICCHNGTARLPATLARLAAQETPPQLQWDVVLVDNASTDETAACARHHWPANHRAELRVVREPQLGVAHARTRGIEAAKYELISFVDDDNWLRPDWLARSAAVMDQRPEVGAMAGRNKPVCEGIAPPWLNQHANWYALALANDSYGDVTERPGFVYSAGMTLRKAAWLELVDCGFGFATMGRQGSILSAGPDIELCLALRLAGWRLWRERDLELQHFLPAPRLQWSYLKRLVRTAGMAAPLLDPYLFALKSPDQLDGASARTMRAPDWRRRALALGRKILGRPYTLIASRLFALEGNHRVIRLEHHIGELTRIVAMRGGYDSAVRRFLDSPVRQALDQLKGAKERARSASSS